MKSVVCNRKTNIQEALWQKIVNSKSFRNLYLKKKDNLIMHALVTALKLKANILTNYCKKHILSTDLRQVFNHLMINIFRQPS